MEYVELNLNVVVDVLGRLNDFQFIYAIYGKMQENNVVLLFDIVQKLRSLTIKSDTIRNVFYIYRLLSQIVKR